MENQTTQENFDPKKNFTKQADGVTGQGNSEKEPASGAELSSDDTDTSGKVYSENLMDRAEQQVRENEDASLQDDTYSFDEANTQNDEYHDAERVDEEGFDSTEYT